MLTLRAQKGSPLTHAEYDGNFQHLASLMTPDAPERVDETDATYFYFGVIQEAGSGSTATGNVTTDWQVRRQNRATGALEYASDTTDFNTAWENRATLTYS